AVLYARLSGIATLSLWERVGATASRLACRVRVTGFGKSYNGSRAGFHTSSGTNLARSASPRRGGTRRSAGMELPRAPRAKGFGIDSQRDAAAPECFRPYRGVHVFA